LDIYITIQLQELVDEVLLGEELGVLKARDLKHYFWIATHSLAMTLDWITTLFQSSQ
jgi:hypothetical protein